MGNRILTREDAAQHGQFVETIERDGVEYDFTLRVLSADQMLSDGLVPLEAVTGTDEEKARTPEEARANAAKADASLKQALSGDLAGRVDKTLVRGMVKPGCWTGPVETCPEGLVPLGDLGPFRDRIIKALTKRSTLVEDLERALRFRDQERVGGVARANVGLGGDVADGVAVHETAS